MEGHMKEKWHDVVDDLCRQVIGAGGEPKFLMVTPKFFYQECHNEFGFRFRLAPTPGDDEPFKVSQDFLDGQPRVWIPVETI